MGMAVLMDPEGSKSLGEGTFLRPIRQVLTTKSWVQNHRFYEWGRWYFLWSVGKKMFITLMSKLDKFPSFSAILIFYQQLSGKMASTPRQCPGVSGKVCNHFLPSYNKACNEICISCHGQSCSKDNNCNHCADRSDGKWEKVKAYLDIVVSLKKKPAQPAKNNPVLQSLSRGKQSSAHQSTIH